MRRYLFDVPAIAVQCAHSCLPFMCRPQLRQQPEITCPPKKTQRILLANFLELVTVRFRNLQKSTNTIIASSYEVNPTGILA